MTDIEYMQIDEVLSEMLEHLEREDFTQEESKELQKMMIRAIIAIMERLEAIEQSL